MLEMYGKETKRARQEMQGLEEEIRNNSAVLEKREKVMSAISSTEFMADKIDTLKDQIGETLKILESLTEKKKSLTQSIQDGTLK